MAWTETGITGPKMYWDQTSPPGTDVNSTSIPQWFNNFPLKMEREQKALMAWVIVLQILGFIVYLHAHLHIPEQQPLTFQ